MGIVKARSRHVKKRGEIKRMDGEVNLPLSELAGKRSGWISEVDNKTFNQNLNRKVKRLEEKFGVKIKQNGDGDIDSNSISHGFFYLPVVVVGPPSGIRRLHKDGIVLVDELDEELK